MLISGEVVNTASGRRLRVDGLLGGGGQGEAYTATDLGSNAKCVLKLFTKSADPAATRARITFLLRQNFGVACRALCAPTDMIDTGRCFGHVAPLAEGQSLEAALASPPWSFKEGLELGSQLAGAVHAMHARDIAHGDLHAENVLVRKVGGAYELSLLDLDNFEAAAAPKPDCIGHGLYIAPELRKPAAGGGVALPNIASDLFALGVIEHELVLLLHAASGADDSEASFNRAMTSGVWVHDTTNSGRPKGIGGYPPEVLSPEVARLFRHSVSLDAAARPTAGMWQAALAEAGGRVRSCASCGGEFTNDVSKVSCPLCRRPHKHLKMITTHGRVIDLDRGAILLGRKELGGSPRISSRHAVARRVGVETWVESYGANGTYRWDGARWMRLANGQPFLISPGDVLSFADTVLNVA